ncbi:SEC-C metal-binding domain-containing protein [Lactococcus garvieae]|uniref:SEC-C metal-binding domain-containing protein n=1 Tax=Lactococcus garvieae TaxID=1363 RepID=UPI001F626228|nr:SEC-C metal-binding domain-containing protein [Lactococcus garvieae]MCI3860256.1 SEC-C domain-containing protein [Lactococcus garvieae]
MTDNKYIACENCDTRINLRIQKGFYNIPFNTQCPKCKTSISGKVYLKNGYDIDLEGATIVEYDGASKLCTVELSAEFPTQKMFYRNAPTKDKIDNIPTPFLRTALFYGNETQDIIQKSMLFAESRTRLNTVKRSYELYWNKKYKILYPKLEKDLQNFPIVPFSKVHNELIAHQVLHYFLISTTGITGVLATEELNKYMSIGSDIIYNTDYHQLLLDFIDNINFDFNKFEQKTFILIDKFSKIYDQLVPVIALRNTGEIAHINKDSLGIMTANFDELSDFYAKSYEWILENIWILGILNNLFIRNDINKFPNGKTYQEFIKAPKGGRLHDGYIKIDETFSKPLGSLNNKLRNAIQHFDIDIDYTTQKITIPITSKEKKKEINYYLIDFANLCIDNFDLMIYLLEIVYNLRKLDYIINKKLSPIAQLTLENSYNNKTKRSSQIHKRKKPGRNEPCPCNSGKKYKKCCLLKDKR